MQWLAFVIASIFGGLAGSLYTFSKGTISPETISVGRSVDGLVMVLLGGIQTLSGPIVGAAVFTWLQDTLARQTDYWEALLGLAMLLMVMAFPQGIVGFVRARFDLPGDGDMDAGRDVKTEQRGPSGAAEASSLSNPVEFSVSDLSGAPSNRTQQVAHGGEG